MKKIEIAGAVSRQRVLLLGASLAVIGVALDGISLSTASAQDETESAERIVVTGSRIVRRDFTAASPIISVTSDDLQASSQVGLETVLNKLPQFAPGDDQFSGAGDVQQSPTNSPGAATLNLRSLGSNRNLVLIDGRRAQPFNASLAIDVNSIPSTAIESVEIITGGAAAVYGADAVAGVVNFKLRRDFTGVELNGQWGQTEAGDGQQVQVGMLLGATLDDDRGNLMVGLNYANREMVLQRDREFYSAAYTDPLTNADIFLPIPQFSITDTTGFVANPPSQAAVDCVFAGVGVGCPFPGKTFSNGAPVPAGEVTVGANLYGVNDDGTVFFPGRSATSRAVGYNGPLAPEFKILATAGNSNNGLVHNNTTASLSAPLERYSLFANGFYDINDQVTAFAQGSYTQTSTTSVGGLVPASIAWSAQIPYNSDPSAIDPQTVNFFGATLPQYVALGCAPMGGCTYGQSHPVPAELKYLLDSRAPAAGGPDGSWNLNMELPYLGPTTIENITDTYQLTAGFRGDLPLGDWTWEVYGTHGNTQVLTDYIGGFVNTAAYQTLIAQPFFGAGYANANNFLGRNATCTSGLPVFDEFTPSDDCIDIIAARMKATTTIAQDIVEANFQGGLFELPAGTVRAAVGAGYRSNDFAFKPDPTMTNTNILSSASGVFDVARAGGSTSVEEVYGELLIPVLAGAPFAQALDIELGARYSDYDTAGGVGTYKAVGNWEVVDWLGFRGGYQLANRAPNVAELFQPPTTIVTVVPNFDACSNITTASYGNVASNPDRAQVQALCTALTGGTVTIDDNFIGLGAFSSLALDQQIGNPDLQSEEATTWTFGAVLNSPWSAPLLDGLTASIDWYEIEITDAIQGLTSATVYEQCFNATGSSNPTYDVNNEFCQLINRDGLFGFPAGVDGIYTNLGAIRTSGVDVQVDWTADVADFGVDLPGSVYANVVVNVLEAYEIQSSSGAPFVDFSGTNGAAGVGSLFDWRTFTSVGYSTGPLAVGLNWRHLPELTNAVAAAEPNEAYDEFDLTASFAINDSLVLRGGVDNVADADPVIVGRIPGVNNAVGSTDPSFYDTLGRRFYVGLKLTL